MRRFCALLALVAAGGMLATMVAGVVVGPFPGWLLVGPLPFYAVGVAAFWRRPDNASVRWLVVTGSCFALEGCLGAALPWAAGDVPAAWLMVIALLRHWAGLGSSFAGLGLIATFPIGRPETWLERAVLTVAGIEAALLPLLNALSSPTLAPGQFADAAEPVVASGIAIPALAWLGPATVQLYLLYPLWVPVGVGLLALRYRRSTETQRRRIGWLLVGWAASVFTWTPLMLVPASAQPRPTALVVVATLLWPLTQVLALGSILVALFQDGVFGIDEPARRRVARRFVRLLIGGAAALVALGLGLLAGRVAGLAGGVVVAVVVTAAARPLWQRLESVADRWLFGARLDGYDMLARFGASLESSSTAPELASELAHTLHAGLGLAWVTVRLDPPIEATGTAGSPAAGTPSATNTAEATPDDETREPGRPVVTTVPVDHAGQALGLITCGPRRDGPLLDEDRHLLHLLAAQAGAAAGALRLGTELAERVDVIRRQAAELSASRNRVVQGQDAERRRIQRDLHDGVQQEIVALSAKVSLAQQRLRRGDPTAADALAELQRDVRGVLADVRDFAYTIHPPVLSDRGLVEAVEGQAARLAVPTRVVADPDLRDTRLPQRVESAAWYAVAEAMSNVVKHASASSAEVTLHRTHGELVISVRDDGRGFDPAGRRGLGLTGMADRLDTVGGGISVDSLPGAGTKLSVRIPIRGDADAVHVSGNQDAGSVSGQERTVRLSGGGGSGVDTAPVEAAPEDGPAHRLPAHDGSESAVPSLAAQLDHSTDGWDPSDGVDAAVPAGPSRGRDTRDQGALDGAR